MDGAGDAGTPAGIGFTPWSLLFALCLRVAFGSGTEKHYTGDQTAGNAPSEPAPSIHTQTSDQSQNSLPSLAAPAPHLPLEHLGTGPCAAQGGYLRV